MERYDVPIPGGGPAGKRAAVQADRIGKRVAPIEREHAVGGTCITSSSVNPATSWGPEPRASPASSW